MRGQAATPERRLCDGRKLHVLFRLQLRLADGGLHAKPESRTDPAAAGTRLIHCLRYANAEAEENEGKEDEEAAELSEDDLRTLAQGFRAFLQGRSSAEDGGSGGSGVEAKDGICTYRGEGRVHGMLK